MHNIIHYAETELAPFSEKPFSEVDSLILSELAYLQMDDIVAPPSRIAPTVRLRDLFRAEYFGHLFEGTFSPDDNKTLLCAAAASPRFRDIELAHCVHAFDTEAELQFFAVTFLLPDGTVYVAFRGTDGTLVGWKEDFNMAYQYPVPAQEQGAAYLNTVGALTHGPIRVGGHSKGGNLAVYAAMNALSSVRGRITDIYSHDGPGFLQSVIKSAAFSGVVDRIRKTIPESSLIGMLLQSQEAYSVVKSDRFWVLQHDPFSWTVEDGAFVSVPALSDSAVYFDRTIGAWLESISEERRRLFIDTMFDLAAATGAETFSDIAANWKECLALIYEAEKKLDPEARTVAREIVNSLVRVAFDQLDLPFFKKGGKEAQLSDPESDNKETLFS